ncbi:MAG: hypothetical protein AAF515_07355 [Pseudomonadota bacterium]
MRYSRQLAALRALFRSLQPYLPNVAGTSLGLSRERRLGLAPGRSELEDLTDDELREELKRLTSAQLPGQPRKTNARYTRDVLVRLLEEAQGRIQVLETELELARQEGDRIPLLTDEWKASEAPKARPGRAARSGVQAKGERPDTGSSSRRQTET